jgi:intraflagellar transport protein 74
MSSACHANKVTQRSAHSCALALLQAELEDQVTLRRAELEKVEGLESKLDTELREITTEIESLQQQVAQHKDLDGLADTARAHEARLSNLQACLEKRVDMLAELAAHEQSRVQAVGDNLMVRHAPRL